MAILWERSAIPWVDGDQAFSGAQAFFFDAGTTTPMITYTDAAESIPHDHPVIANSMGIFPGIFITEGAIFKFRVLDEDGGTIVEVDNVAAPTTVPPEFPDSNTQPEFLFQTGDLKPAWRTSSPTGWVRANGRTIGAAASGATERANADCEDLFIHLWDEDDNLAVSGGRGVTSAGDWAANKQIALPDLRGRILGGLDSMGNSASGRITDAEIGADSDTLGTAGGDATHALITAELASHTHTGDTDNDGTHGHTVRLSTNGGGNTAVGGLQLRENSSSNYPAFTGTPADTAGEQIGGGGVHIHAFTTDATGSGTPHNNLQPTVLVPFFIKL